jgi:hypothetical protein
LLWPAALTEAQLVVAAWVFFKLFVRSLAVFIAILVFFFITAYERFVDALVSDDCWRRKGKGGA